jgi:hypothetical protein
VDSARIALAQSIADVKALGIPMGYVVPDSVAMLLARAHWLSADTATLKGDSAPRTIPSKLRLYLGLYPPQIAAGLVGLLLTTLALSLGAPFWFDILNKIVNVRAVGRTPAENAKVKANQGR